jgi:hypothetical protein
VLRGGNAARSESERHRAAHRRAQNADADVEHVQILGGQIHHEEVTVQEGHLIRRRECLNSCTHRRTRQRDCVRARIKSGFKYVSSRTDKHVCSARIPDQRSKQCLVVAGCVTRLSKHVFRTDLTWFWGATHERENRICSYYANATEVGQFNGRSRQSSILESPRPNLSPSHLLRFVPCGPIFPCIEFGIRLTSQLPQENRPEIEDCYRSARCPPQLNKNTLRDCLGPEYGFEFRDLLR